jgi:hypothetical protein
MPAPNAAPGGPLSIQNLEPGSYWLQDNPMAPWYLASASCGGVDLTHEPFTIAGGTAGCTMRVVLRNDSASLHWSLDTNNERNQSPSVFIYAIPLENIAQPLSTSSTQKEALPQGSLEDLAPGRYLVIAFDCEQQLAYRETDALEKYSSLGKEVTLTPGGTSEVQLDLVNEQMVNREQ